MSAEPPTDPELLRKFMEMGKPTPTPLPKIIARFLENDALEGSSGKNAESSPQAVAPKNNQDSDVTRNLRTNIKNGSVPVTEESKSLQKETSPNWAALENLFEEWAITRVLWGFCVREGKAVKSGLVAVIILCGLSALSTYEFMSSKLDGEISALRNEHNRDIGELGVKVHGLERDLDDAKRERDKAQSDLAPWIVLANQSKKDSPQDQRLDILLQQVQSFVKNLDNTKVAVQNLAAIAEADREYHDMAMLNMIGKPQLDGDIVYTTAISKAMDGSYVMNGSNVTYKTDAQAEKKFRDVIQIEPKYPFSYVGLAKILHDRGDVTWKKYADKAMEILEQTTLVPGHHPNHDLLLKYLKENFPF